MLPPRILTRNFLVVVGVAAAAWFGVVAGCGSGGSYSRGITPGQGGTDQAGADGTGLILGGGGESGTPPGTGGLMLGSGGAQPASTGGGAGRGNGGSGAAVAPGGNSASGGQAAGGGGTTIAPPASGGSNGGAAGRGTGAGAVGGNATGSGGAGSTTTGSGGTGSGGSVASGGTGLTGTTGTGGIAASGGASQSGGVGSGGSVAGGGVPGSGAGGVGGRVAGAGGAGGVAVKILSIDLVGALVSGSGGNRVAVPAPSMAPTEVAGFKPAANWNSAGGPMGTLTALAFSDGTASGASATWSAPFQATSFGVYFVGLTDAPGDARMMNGYLDPSEGTTPVSTISVSGLALSGGYDVYVYFLGGLGTLAAGQTRSHKLTIGATSFSVSQAAPSPTTFAGYLLATATTGNYVVFKNVTGASFTLTSTAVSGTTMRAPVNGLQIVWPSGS